MFSLILSFVFLWITIQFTQQAMDFQKDVCGWLDDATLFPTNQQQVDGEYSGFCFDVLTFLEDGKVKEHDVDDINISITSDILDEDNWMDSKIDLSILDSAFQDCLTSTENDNQKSEFTDIGSEIESLVDSYFQQSATLPFGSLLDSPVGDVQVASSVSEAYAIPEATTSCVSTLSEEIGLQLLSSPLEKSWSNISSPPCVPSISDDNFSDVSENSSNEKEFIPVSYIEVSMSVDDQVNLDSVIKRSEKRLPKLRVQSKANIHSFSPYQLKKESRKERKKIQNKEAASRYRVKKKEQDKVLIDEAEVLENEQKSLQAKHDELKTEIKYLKSLMKEMFKARGLLK